MPDFYLSESSTPPPHRFMILTHSESGCTVDYLDAYDYADAVRMAEPDMSRIYRIEVTAIGRNRSDVLPPAAADAGRRTITPTKGYP